MKRPPRSLSRRGARRSLGAVFNATYHAQTLVDAELTNGADVTVTGTMQAPASAKQSELAALPGVSAAQPMQHRLAYVGTDLQDLYGIDAARIGEATKMSNAYFANADAKKTLALLARTPDGILVSAETVKDFQLQPGDTVNLRLQSASDLQYHVVPFRFIGVVREFPTAPRDSFLVANAGYIAKVTGSAASEIVLLKTSAAPASIAAAARSVVAALPGVEVSDLGEAQRLIGSSLTAVDLGGMTRLELGLAVLMVASAGVDQHHLRDGLPAGRRAAPPVQGTEVRSFGLLACSRPSECRRHFDHGQPRGQLRRSPPGDDDRLRDCAGRHLRGLVCKREDLVHP